MVEGGGRIDASKVAIIHEVYDSENSHETFELELERALEAGCAIIIVEPSRLGDETARWISVGNCLHKTAVLTGLFSIGSGLIWTDRPYVYTPLGALSLFCTGLYTVSWQMDPCCQYQVESDPAKLEKLSAISALVSTLASATPVVLVRQDNTRRNLLHAGVSLLATFFCAWRLYETYK